MTARVIQGFFVGGRPRLAPPLQPKMMVPSPIQPKAPKHPPGPPAPAFAGGRARCRRHGAGGAFAIDAGRLGLIAGGGRPLPDASRSKMEAALGADFSMCGCMSDRRRSGSAHRLHDRL
ncbi:MAG TPA: hypothetical protein VGI28_07435, partial [Stellaceae bacterium]